MGRRCFVPMCTSGYDSNTEKVSSFKVPKDKLKEWERAISRIDRKLSLSDHVCEKHFQSEEIIRMLKTDVYTIPLGKPKLADGAVPSIFPHGPNNLSKTTKKRGTLQMSVNIPNKKQKIETSFLEISHGKTEFINLKSGTYPSCNFSTPPCIEDPLADAAVTETKLRKKLNETSKDEEFKESFADTETDMSSEILSRKVYKWCFVPQCTNTSISTPNKIFLSVPRNEERQRKWFNAAQREQPTSKSTFYCCQDHFKLEEDMENYTYYKFMGGAIKIKKKVLPHIFNCQADRKRAASARRSTMPGTYCAISTCKNSHFATKLGDARIKYHTFPSNLKLQRQWLQACKRVRTCNPKTHRICSIHFRDEDYERDLKAELLGLPVNRKLKENAVPSLHLKDPPVPSLHLKGPPVRSRLKRKRSRSNSSPSKVVKDASLDSVEQSVEIPNICCKSEDITIEMHDVKQEVNEPVYQFEQVLLGTQNTSHFEFVSAADVNMDEMVNEENGVVIVPHSDSADILNDIVLDENSTETNSEKQEFVIKSNEIYSCTNAECQILKRNNESLLEKNKILNSQLKIAEEQLKVKDLKIQQMKTELLYLKSDEYQKDMLDNKIRQMKRER